MTHFPTFSKFKKRMDQAKQEMDIVEKDLRIATDITTRAKNAAKTLMEAAESLKVEAILEAATSIAVAESKILQRLNEAEIDATKKIDSATFQAKQIIISTEAEVIVKTIEIAKWEEEKKRIASTHNFEQTIKLDIGGHSFTTTLTTLTRFPDSMIGAMFSGRHALIKNEAGAYFIDRDGRHFHYILNFLRSPESFDKSCVQGSTLIETKHEAEYYGLKDLMFPWAPAEPEDVLSLCRNGTKNEITVIQMNDQLWYMKYKNMGPDPVVVHICDTCGSGWPASYGQNYLVQKFTKGRTISADQPRKTGTCPHCRQ